MHRGTQPTVLAQKTYKGCLKCRFSKLTRHHNLAVESANGNTFKGYSLFSIFNKVDFLGDDGKTEFNREFRR